MSMSISEIADIISVILLYIIAKTNILIAKRIIYEEALEHSKRFFRSKKLGSSNKGHKNFERIIYREYKEEFIQHLKTGYPEIYKLYEEWEIKKKEMVNKLDKFKEELSKEIENRGLKIVPSNSSSIDDRVVFKRIHKMFRKLFDKKIVKNIKIDEQVKLEVKNEQIYCSLYLAGPISPNPLIKDELEKLIKDLLNSDKLINLYKEYDKLRKERDEIEKELYGKVRQLAKKIELGQPIKGYCDSCPEEYKVLMKLRRIILKFKNKKYKF